MNDHLDEQLLNDYVDGGLNDAARERAAVHLSSCDVCREATQRLHRLRAELASLPRSIAPPAHVLMDVHAAIMENIAGPPVRATWVERHWKLRPAPLAAAALILIALSSATTALLLRPRSAHTPAPAATAPTLDTGSAGLVAMQAMDRSYQDAIAELQHALREQETGLAPETLQVLQTNLEIIDNALGEARAALSADPGNDALTALVRSGYERKLDVLRSARSHVRASS